MLSAHDFLAFFVVGVPAAGGTRGRARLLAPARRGTVAGQPARARADAARRPGRTRPAAPLRRPPRRRRAPLRLRLALARPRSSRPGCTRRTRGRSGCSGSPALLSSPRPRRASIHDRIVKRFFTEMNATLRGFLIIALIALRHRRALAPVRARDGRRAAPDRLLPRDRVLPLPALAREARRHRVVAGPEPQRLLRRDRPRRRRHRRVHRPAPLGPRRARVLPRARRRVRHAVFRIWRQEHTYS